MKKGKPMRPLVFRSRTGSAILIAAGVFDVLAGLALLMWYLVTNWGADGMMDRFLQLLLVLVIVAGARFAAIGLRRFRQDGRIAVGARAGNFQAA